MKITLLNTGVHSASENMAIDQSLLEKLDPQGDPILHLYQWKGDSLTYGHFTKPENLLDLEAVQNHGLSMAKRVTGGGVTFHFSDYAFSFLMPKNHFYYSENTLENYAFVNQFVLQAVSKVIAQTPSLELLKNAKKEDRLDERFKFCMAQPTKYDVLLNGKKVGGAAQRRTTRGYLHHGSVAIALPDPSYLKSILLSKKRVFDAIYEHSHAFVSTHLDQESIKLAREKVEKELIKAFIDF